MARTRSPLLCCTIQSYRFTLMRLFVCLVSDTQVPTSWHALRIGLVDLVEAAPIGIFLGSSAPLQVELRMSPACRCGGASVARAPNRGPGGRVRHRCLSAPLTVIRVMARKRMSEHAPVLLLLVAFRSGVAFPLSRGWFLSTARDHARAGRNRNTALAK